MAITDLPTPPSRSTPSTFSTLADAFIAALPVFVTEANAQAAALTLNATNANSTTSVAIGTGAKNLTVDVSKSYQPGMSVKIARTSSPSNWMHGDVTSYNSGTGALVVNVLAIFGSGTFTDWTITLSASGSGNVVSDANIVANGLVIGDNGAKGVKELALGTALQVLRMNAGGTLPEWVARIIDVSDLVYSAAWNGTVDKAPSKNVVYDKMETKADKGANSDITSITGLTTPLTKAQGGSGTTGDSIVKAWVKCGVTGNILDDFNVDTVGDDGTGLITVNWDTNFATVNYVPNGITMKNTSANIYTVGVLTQAAGSASFQCGYGGTGLYDPEAWFIMAIGDQA